MKKFFFTIFIICLTINLNGQCTAANTQVITNGLDISFDQQSGTVIFGGLDPCSYTQEELEIFDCRLDCERDCFNFCQTHNNSQSAVEFCITHCQNLVINCQNECGPIPEPSKTAILYYYSVNLWYNTGFTETWQGDPKERIFSELIWGIPPMSIEVPLVNELPEESLSYCYFTELIIQYDDGTCCLFRDFECFNKG